MSDERQGKFGVGDRVKVSLGAGQRPTGYIEEVRCPPTGTGIRVRFDGAWKDWKGGFCTASASELALLERSR